MEKPRLVQTIAILTISVLLTSALPMPLRAAPQGPAEANGKVNSEVSDPPISISASWFATTQVPPAFFWTGGDGARSSSGPFTFSCGLLCAIGFGGSLYVRVTDDFLKGDVFEVFDNNVSIGTTSFVAVVSPAPEVGPDAAYADSTYSSGCFTIGAFGSHAIDIVAKISPFGGGRGYVEVHGGACPGPRILGIEVTQSIQFFRDIGDSTDRNPSVPDNSIVRDVDGRPLFVNNKRTLVRVYIDSNGPAVSGTVTLRAVDPATGMDLAPPRITRPSFVAVDNPARSRIQDTGNFVLLETHPWVGLSGLRLQAEFKKVVSSYLQISFTPKPVLRIGFVQVRYCPNGNGNGAIEAGETCYLEPITPASLSHPAHACPTTCTGGNVAHTHPNIRTGHFMAHHMLPFREVQFIPLGGEVIFDSSLTSISNAGTLLSRLDNRLTSENIGRILTCIFSFGQTCPPTLDRIFGWTPFLDVPDISRVGYNGATDSNRAMFGNANNIDPDPTLGFPFGKWRRTMAHELVHTFGQAHNNLILNEYGWDAEYGDTLVTFAGNTIGAIKSRDLFDIMVAGQAELKAWINPSIYQAIWSQAGLLPVQLESRLLAQPVDGIIMSGRLDNATGRFTLDPFWRNPIPFPPECPSLGKFSVDFQDSAGGVLLRCFIDPRGPLEDLDCPPESLCPPLERSFSIATSYPTGTASIVFKRGIETINIVPVSPSMPTVTIRSPAPGSLLGDLTSVEWTATDKDGNPLACNVLFSTDAGKSFTPVGDMVKGGQRLTGEFLLDTTGLAGGANRAIQVACSDGVNVGLVTAGGLSMSRKSPIPTIALVDWPPPRTGLPTPRIVLSGSAFDPEDGELPGEKLEWFASSPEVTPLGNGKSLFAELPDGTHTITLRATDSDGNVVETSITLTVEGLKTAFELDYSDYDNDGKVTILDFAQAASVFDLPSIYWDLNLNGKVDVTEIALIAFNFDRVLGVPPEPFFGSGQPLGKMDPIWRELCSVLPEPHRTYCQTRI